MPTINFLVNLKGCSPFEIVYGRNSLTHFELVYIFSTIEPGIDAKIRVKKIQNFYE